MRFDVAVVGLGYVGLALSRVATSSGLRVAGYDIHETVVDELSQGRTSVDDISPEDLRAMDAAGFVPTTKADVLGDAAAVVICVPTPLAEDGRPDLLAVRTASATVGSQLRRGMLVVLESTSYPGTTEEVVGPILEQTSGLVAGRDFHLAFSSERVDPGNKRFGLDTTPKVVGGLTPECTAVAARFYRRMVRSVVLAKGTREAELSKIIENTYRNVNIALINEIAKLAHELGIDVWDAIDCAATKPFGFQAFYPGAGPGGHCIPVDPNYLAFRARTAGSVFRIGELAQEINNAMPRYVVQRAIRLLNAEMTPVNGAEVLLLGVSYKPNVADLRGAPSITVARQLRALGATVSYHDPFVANWTVDGEPVSRETDASAAAQRADLTILLQDHTVYDPAELARTTRLLLDTRGHTRRHLQDRRREVL
ncbi:nucleotide sugar dehydrogenase [Micromonospora sp. NPDC050980]|uniref:nucleotide sugar dehydrogenase n=1 Tax=Micromonospora sp. NPDC050980 TaxID=3155161 RepID=UPI0033E3B8B5